MDWRRLAACRDTPDPDLFFPVNRTHAAARPAKALCRPCPVIAECRSWAVANEAYGVWGGLDEHERARLRRRLRTRRVVPTSSGEDARPRITEPAPTATTLPQRAR